MNTRGEEGVNLYLHPKCADGKQHIQRVRFEESATGMGFKGFCLNVTQSTNSAWLFFFKKGWVHGKNCQNRVAFFKQLLMETF